MTIFQGIILSIIEGITEFLPISSTGHLIVASQILRIPQTEITKSFEIFIQLGAIAAVAMLYSKKLLAKKTLWLPTLIAFVPTALVGLVFYSLIKQYLLGNIWVVAVSLLVGGVAIIVIEAWYKTKRRDTQLTVSNSWIIGIFQSLSVIPGVSRSAATILGAMKLGIDRETAVEFSFFLSLPTMLAATTLDLVKSYSLFAPSDLPLFATGFIGAFVTAIIVIKIFLDFIKHHSFVPFGIYRIFLSILLVALLLTGVIS